MGEKREFESNPKMLASRRMKMKFSTVKSRSRREEEKDEDAVTQITSAILHECPFLLLFLAFLSHIFALNFQLVTNLPPPTSDYLLINFASNLQMMMLLVNHSHHQPIHGLDSSMIFILLHLTILFRYQAILLAITPVCLFPPSLC